MANTNFCVNLVIHTSFEIVHNLSETVTSESGDYCWTELPPHPKSIRAWTWRSHLDRAGLDALVLAYWSRRSSFAQCLLEVTVIRLDVFGVNKGVGNRCTIRELLVPDRRGLGEQILSLLTVVARRQLCDVDVGVRCAFLTCVQGGLGDIRH